MPLRNDIKKVLVIGSGPIVIGQAAEFDYAGTQACLALKEEGIEVILLNNNPATIMTDKNIANKVYIEPLTIDTIVSILKKEKPDGIIGTLGGQTGLNLAVQLEEKGILKQYGVELLGTSVESIKNGEDRDRFRQLMLNIGEPVPQSAIVHSIEEGYSFVSQCGYPVIIRPAYTLGGAGGGFASNDEELELTLNKGLSMSPIHQVLLEKSIKGWKEIEYEVMRDQNDTCIIVCNMENMDPVGVHTGDSIVVAPSQTLSDVQYQKLRNASLKVIRHLGIVGGCNIQFALDPNSDDYHIIEVNPRVSRSSALASKATGYPIARIAAKLAIGYNLDEILNPITGTTYASFEPALDYVVVKLPRFPFDKFIEADSTLGTQMKATGEVMAIDRTFEAALNKSLRSLEMKGNGLYLEKYKHISQDDFLLQLTEATDTRLYAIAEAFRRGFALEQITSATGIDPWFLNKIQFLVSLQSELEQYSWEDVPLEKLREAKSKNMSDAQLSQIFNIKESLIRERWKKIGWKPSYKQVDTCAAEFDAVTPYYYSTWLGKDEVEVTTNKKIVVLGSGPIRIGQGIEFDYCSVHAALALKKKGYEAIVINNNPETVSTDYAIADKLYFEPLTVEDIIHIVQKEGAEGVLVQFGGQTAINLSKALEEEGVTILGTQSESIDLVEDREQFYQLLGELNIPHIPGKTANRSEELMSVSQQLGYPIIVRPSYVIGGQSMHIFHNEEEMESFISTIDWERESRLWPLLVDRYIAGMECEVDVISDGENIIIPGIFEHIEKAGVHSGDSISIYPPISLSDEQKKTIINYAKGIANKASLVGIFNIQFVLHEEQVYVLEVNPRSSRTVPIMSKVTDVPMIEWATLVQLGDKLVDLHEKMGLLPEQSFYSVKTPVFSGGKLRGVDHVLGPEMKSTGEVLGLGFSANEAMEKSIFLGQTNPFRNKDEKSILCSFTERDKKESLKIVTELIQRGFSIFATKGTAAFYQSSGIFVEKIVIDVNEIEQQFKENKFAVVLNTPTQGRNKEKFGFKVRELAARFSVPVYTHIDTIQAALSVTTQYSREILSVDQYFNVVK